MSTKPNADVQANACEAGSSNEIARPTMMLPLKRDSYNTVRFVCPQFRQEMLDMAQQMNLIPAPSLCDENGDAVFTLAQLAEQLGVTVEEAEASFNLMVTERRALGLPIPKPVGGPIHRLH